MFSSIEVRMLWQHFGRRQDWEGWIEYVQLQYWYAYIEHTTRASTKFQEPSARTKNNQQLEAAWRFKMSSVKPILAIFS